MAGRKAMGQADNLIAGYLREVLIWMRCRVSMGALESYTKGIFSRAESQFQQLCD